MTTGAIAGVGTVFQRWDGEDWVTLAEINSIEGPDVDRDAIDVTSFDTEGGYDETITGFMNGGSVVLNMNFTRSTFELMKVDFEIDVVRAYRIRFADYLEPCLTFDGMVTDLPITVESESQMTVDVTIQITGEVSFEVAIDDSEDVSSSGLYDDDLETYLNSLTTELSDLQISRLQAFVSNLKSSLGITNLSDTFDVMYILANETEEAALKNLVKRAHDCSLLSESSIDDPAFVAFEGYTGGKDRAIDTNYNPSTQGVNYTLNDCSFGIYSRTNSNGTYVEMGIKDTDTNATQILARYGGDTIMRVHNSTFPFIKDDEGDSLGMFIACRNSNVYTGLFGYKNKVSLARLASADLTTTIPNLNFYILAENYSGVIIYPSNRQVAFAFAGKYLSSAEVAVVTDVFEAYMDAYGKGVIT